MDKRDYEEPVCPCDFSQWVKTEQHIPISRIAEKSDEYYAQNQTEAVLSLLIYWWNEAVSYQDKQGLLFLSNELMGFYRKNPNEEKAFSYADVAEQFLTDLKLEETLSGMDTYTNIGTVCTAFEKPQKALTYYEKALNTAGKLYPHNSPKCAGLYNNYALAQRDCGNLKQAEIYFEYAITASEDAPNQAISYVNLFEVTENREFLKRAIELMDEEQNQDGYYAYVCEKLSPAFCEYGYEIYGNELLERAERIRKQL